MPYDITFGTFSAAHLAECEKCAVLRIDAAATVPGRYAGYGIAAAHFFLLPDTER